MKSEHLKRVKEVLAEALRLSPAERPAFLEGICNSVVRREVESLLAQDDICTPILERPLFCLGDENQRIGTEDIPMAPKRHIGPYEIVEKIGAGGMGTVFLAVREDDFHKRVALKIVRSELLSDDLLDRFRNEREIVAQLEHPYIARILDGGSEDGCPYFVMEHVEGLGVDVYCEQKRLPLQQRLTLFRKICSAVQFAHQNLVVHRDLKPSNILVMADGTPKLLDFGIAKRLGSDPGRALTTLDQRPMTLRYASPEQIDSDLITTASDIYTLGVLLFELLTGEIPYVGDIQAPRKLEDAIRDGKLRHPSTASRQADPDSKIGAEDGRPSWHQLVGDLDSITLKALGQKPHQRYGSVEQLADDLRRFQEGLPVNAREATFFYVSRKLLQRHQLALAVATGLVVFGLLFAVTVTALWRNAVEERERREVVVKIMQELFWAPILRGAPGQKQTTHEILERSLTKVDQLAAEPALQAEILQAVAKVHDELGDYPQTLKLRQRAVYILQAADPKPHPDLARAINNLADAYDACGRDVEAEKFYREALAMKRQLNAAEVDLPKALSNLAKILSKRGELVEAATLYREVLVLREAAKGPGHASVATTLRSLANALFLQGELAEAESLLRRALQARRELGPGEPGVAAVLSTLGRVLHAQGRLAEAEACFDGTLAIRRQHYAEEDRRVAVTKVDLATLLLDRALGLDHAGPEAAETLLMEALSDLRRAYGGTSWQVANAETSLGALRTSQGRFVEAEELLKRSVRRLAEIRGEEASYTRAARRRLRELDAARSEGGEER
jgi:serine/threonine protein kinase/Flp pilus assembly protein TadD